MLSASAWSWVTKSAVTRARARISRTSWRSRSRSPASRFENGSSSRISSGVGASARASATRCCWPPESSCTGRSASAVEPDQLEHLGDRGRGRACGRARSRRCRRRRGGGRARSPGTPCRSGAAPGRRTRPARRASRSPIAISPASGRSSPAISRSVVVLPHPDGPEQGADRARLDLELDPVDGAASSRSACAGRRGAAGAAVAIARSRLRRSPARRAGRAAPPPPAAGSARGSRSPRRSRMSSGSRSRSPRF